MFYEMTPTASQAIFQWKATPCPESGKSVLRGSGSFCDPLVVLACEIQDLAIVRDEQGEETWEDEQSIPIKRIMPYALSLVRATAGHPSEVIKSLRRQLKEWIEGGRKKDRAYNIKSIVFQICGEIISQPVFTKPSDEIPF